MALMELLVHSGVVVVAVVLAAGSGSASYRGREGSGTPRSVRHPGKKTNR